MNSEKERRLSKKEYDMSTSTHREELTNPQNGQSKDVCPECGEKTFMQGRSHLPLLRMVSLRLTPL